jgi:peptidoglycan/LPS O-acetylase OafA/YrhL
LIRLLRIAEAEDPGRNFGLDVVRASAISLVLVAHGRVLLPPSRWSVFLANGAYLGVELFFVLSGFLIGTLLLREFDRPQAPGIAPIGRFWIRRWFRTVPNYLLFLLLNLTLFPWLFGRQPFDARYLFFLQNLAWPCPPFMPESWSLAVEEWFYLSLPLLMLLFAALPLARKRGLLACCLVYVSSFLVIRLLAAVTAGPEWDDGVRKVVLYRLDAIGYGVLIGYFQHFHGGGLRRHKRLLLGLGAACVVLSVIAFSYGRLTTMETIFNKTLLFPITDAGFAAMLPFLRDIEVERGHLVRLASHISIASYSMYLVHYSFVIPLLARAIRQGLPGYLAYVTYLAATLALATLVYRGYESPMTRLRERFAPSPPPRKQE